MCGFIFVHFASGACIHYAPYSILYTVCSVRLGGRTYVRVSAGSVPYIVWPKGAALGAAPGAAPRGAGSWAIGAGPGAG